MASKSVWLLLLLSYVTSPGVLSDIILRPSCISGWFYYKSHCYGYFRKLGNWSNAEMECQSFGDGSHLASVLNQKEINVISEYISGYQRSQPVWIGLHDPHKRRQWEWIDGSTYQYKSWSAGATDGDGRCAELNPRSKFLTWSESQCDKRHHFLCKYRP